MALSRKCERGHYFIQPDLIRGLPEGAPVCPTCYAEWELGQEIKKAREQRTSDSEWLRMLAKSLDEAQRLSSSPIMRSVPQVQYIQMSNELAVNLAHNFRALADRIEVPDANT